VLVYVAPSGLGWSMVVVVDTGLHPVLIYVALSGLWLSMIVVVNTGLHPVLRYVAPSGLGIFVVIYVIWASPYAKICRPFGAWTRGI